MSFLPHAERDAPKRIAAIEAAAALVNDFNDFIVITFLIYIIILYHKSLHETQQRLTALDGKAIDLVIQYFRG